MRRLLPALAACLLALCGLPLTAGPALAGPVRAGPGRLIPGPGEWWFGTWQVQRKVWPLSRGAGITVAEVESGVQASLPDLRGVVLPGADLTGASRDGDTDIQAGEDGHGTAMAVMIAGQGRGTGTVGIAPRARILPVVVGGSGPRSVAAAAAGIRYAAAHGAQVIDLPFGIGVTSPARCDPVLQAAVAYALGRDAVLIASAGNTSLFAGPGEPASCAGVLAVGGRFTTTGAGTSFAAALTAGAAALIRARYPHMPWYEVDQRLTGTATPAGHPGPGDGYGCGIVNLARAVNASAYPVRAAAPDPVRTRYRAWLATPAGRTLAARYRLARPGPAASAAAAAPSPGGGPRLPLGEIAATGAAAACAFVAVLLAVLWMSSRRARSRAPAQWEARTWSFGPDEDDPPGWS